MVELPDLVTKEIKKAKDGYRTSSMELIEDILRSLKSGIALSDDHKSYLIECLERTVELDDADKGFYLRYGRGKKKSETFQRDYHAAEFMLENPDLSYDERLSAAADEIYKQFPEFPCDKKTVAAAYTKYKEAIIVTRKIRQEAYSK